MVLLYPETLGTEHAGLAVLVGAPDARSWQPLAQLLVSSQIGTFDATVPNASSLSFDGQQGIILYSGTSAAGVQTGLARLWPSDAQAPPTPPAACGDGACAEGESCETCPADCTCPGKIIADDVVSTGNQHWLTSSRSGHGSPYFDEQLGSLLLQPTDSAWAERTLDQPLIGDFALEAELTIPNSASSLHDYPPLDSLYFGVGQAPASAVGVPEGVFARVTIFPPALGAGGCFASNSAYALSPFVSTSAGRQSTLPIGSTDCPAGSRLLVPFAEPHHIELTRRGGVISVTSFDKIGCPSSVSLEQTLPLPELSSIVAGTYNTQPGASGTGSAELSNVTLRLLADPASCPKGTVKCGEQAEQASCVVTDTTPEHCGACGVACRPGARCVGGTCACTKQQLDCPDECADGNRSAMNCGACGNRCGAYCLLGECDVGETCADAKVLPRGPGSYDFDPSRARADATFCGGGASLAADLFFAWTPKRTGHATVRLHGTRTRIDTALTVTPDPACASYDPAWCNDDDRGPGGESLVSIDVEVGVSYYIGASLLLGRAPGPLTLSIEEK